MAGEEKPHLLDFPKMRGSSQGHHQVKNNITQFYENLFRQPINSNIQLVESGIEFFSNEDNNILIKGLSLNELKEAVFGMTTSNSASPKCLGEGFFLVEIYESFSGSFEGIVVAFATIACWGELTDLADKLVWKLTNSSAFFNCLVFYSAVQIHRLVSFEFLWKVKIPIKLSTSIFFETEDSINP